MRKGIFTALLFAPRKMFNEVKIKDAEKYRYVRYISADWFPGDIAEAA